MLSFQLLHTVEAGLVWLWLWGVPGKGEVVADGWSAAVGGLEGKSASCCHPPPPPPRRCVPSSSPLSRWLMTLGGGPDGHVFPCFYSKLKEKEPWSVEDVSHPPLEFSGDRFWFK